MKQNIKMTIREAAEYLKVTVQTVRNYIDRGWLVPLSGPTGRGRGKLVRLSAREVQNFFTYKSSNSLEPNEN